LIVLGRPAGDKDAPPESVADIVKLLRRPLPWGLELIHRHSGSKTAVIRIAREPDKIYAEVQDHGKGISAERLAEIQSHGVGVGITGMRERVRQSHGELTIDSDVLGTKITAIFPAKTPAMKEQGTISRHGVA
jgi:signal transduction histidine kinase